MYMGLLFMCLWSCVSLQYDLNETLPLPQEEVGTDSNSSWSADHTACLHQTHSQFFCPPQHLHPHRSHFVYRNAKVGEGRRGREEGGVNKFHMFTPVSSYPPPPPPSPPPPPLRCRDERAWRVLQTSVLLLVAALAAWLSDKFCCSLWLSLGFPYLHSVWHLLILGSAYLASVLCAYLYALQETPHLKPRIVFWPSWLGSGIPYVQIVESIAT